MDAKNIPLSTKRETLAKKIETIRREFEDETANHAVTNLRFNKLAEWFKIYDKLADKLEMTRPEDPQVVLAEELRTNYYELSSKILHANQARAAAEDLLNKGTLNNSTNNNTTTDTHRRAKLPTTEIPKFDGNFENWLSFKNKFQTMMEKREDVEDIDKFIYLRGALHGTASHKLSLFDASAENYQRAWALLTDTYQKGRPLAYKHYDALLHFNPISNATNENLTKLIDEARQHLNCLDTLKAKPTEAFMVRILELKLPIEIRDKWEETFDDDNILPTFELFSKFVTKTAFRLRSRKPESHTNSFKRRRDQTGNPRKYQRTEHTTGALVTSISSTCAHCKGSHPLYKCPHFNTLTVDQRVKFVKSARLCQNCMRNHKGACTSIRYKTCNKFHHTMLHYPRNTINEHTGTNTQRIQTPATAAADKSATT
ncbi:uncharacterized protein LOC124183638 [Neodiprion fabricii]|uniref:uncharacterized protein LOC124183638 n=1 Tax=Neodiprion fabricii TaxID=2872261 RepID=UPI001ED91365|nr:uncharacterized protein LOC124183638 [Neodiprion fabricii]